MGQRNVVKREIGITTELAGNSTDRAQANGRGRIVSSESASH